MSQTTQSSPGFNGQSSTDQTPPDELGIYHRVINGGVPDDFLNAFNLGLGNYSAREYWQQVDSYRNGMFADAAFSRLLIERAIDETKRDLALNGYAYYDESDERPVRIKGWNDLDEDGRKDAWEDLFPDTDLEPDRRRYIAARGDEIWSQLPHEGAQNVQFEALRDVTGLARDWVPPFWKMLMMRHESSRSRGARLIDNVFGRVRVTKNHVSEAAEKSLARLGGE